MKIKILTGLMCAILLGACVSKKKYNQQLESYANLKKTYEKTSNDLDTCNLVSKLQKDTINELRKEVDELKTSGGIMLGQLTDLSVISKTQAESIKKSLDALSSKDAYIKDLQVAISRKDSLNLALVMNLKGALKDINDKDVDIKVEGSAVFISLSDKMLYNSGGFSISAEAKTVLSKVAEILKAQPDLQFMVEGHTDNQPVKANKCVADNWDLSVLRATAIVRVLQSQFGVDPSRMIAAGRSQYQPMVGNDNAANRSTNRRTRIMLIPQLDQFFKLLEQKQ